MFARRAFPHSRRANSRRVFARGGLPPLREGERDAAEPEARGLILVGCGEGRPRGPKMVHVVEEDARCARENCIPLADASVGPLSVSERDEIDDGLEERVWPPITARDAERRNALEECFGRVPLEEFLPGGEGEIQDGVPASTEESFEELEGDRALHPRMRQIVRQSRPPMRALHRDERRHHRAELRED